MEPQSKEAVLNTETVQTKSNQCWYQQGVCQTVALPFTLKKYLKAKEELWKLKYFTMQKYNL